MEELQSLSPQNNRLPMQHQNMIQIQDLFYLCLKRWYWFVISVACTLCLATFYLLKTVPIYTRSAELLIKEDSKGNSFASGMDQSFADMGFIKSNTNVNNEILAVKSLNVIEEVVKRLNLNINYAREGRFHSEVAYGAGRPLTVNFIDFPENGSGSLTLRCDTQGKVYLSEFVRSGEELVQAPMVSGTMRDTLVTPLGRLSVLPTAYYDHDVAVTLQVSHAPLQGTVRGYAGGLNVSLSDKKATVIKLTLNDVCPQRAEDILNTVIAVYNENWVKDKNQIAVSTSHFINERLAVIEQELGHVDENISTFKSKNLLPDVQAASNLYMAKNTETNAQLSALNNQLYMTRYIREYVIDPAHKNQLLPANSGIGNTNIESQISAYNGQLLQRNNLVLNSSEKNPLVIDLDMTLASLRQAIVVSIDNQLETLNAQIQSLEKSERQTTSKIAANPSQAKYLLSVERQQKVKEALYLFLLQKREENELSQAFTAYNNRVMTKPNGNDAPTSPVRNKVMLVALMLGLLFPLVIVYLREFMNTAIRGRHDLDGLSVPFMGEIPFCGTKRKGFWKKMVTGGNKIVVKNGRRDIINEAFRVLRTNLEFMTESKANSNVILLTSYNQGSGKSFLTMNIALSLAIKEKKVLVIDGDMRYAAVSSYVDSPKVGLSSYLNGLVEDIREIIVPDANHPMLHILPVGILPPNPTELLYSSRLEEMILQVKQEYDYVLIDCPPIEVVADVQIIEKYVDRTIFVVRAGLLERKMLADVQALYDQKKFKNMTLVLNGTECPMGFYNYKYAYHYGYHYGRSLKKFSSSHFEHKSRRWVEE